MTRTIAVEHLARVEGHGGITIELEGERVTDVQFGIFEGARLLERLIRGRVYTDVAPVVSRICAICSVAHSLTSIQTTETAFGVSGLHFRKRCSGRMWTLKSKRWSENAAGFYHILIWGQLML